MPGILLVLLVGAQDPDTAVRRGAEFLRKKFSRGFDASSWNSRLEVVMLALAEAGVPRADPVFEKGLEALEDAKLRYTYRVAFLALALSRIDAERYRSRLAHCAQWLVDTQLAEGEWSYPPTWPPDEDALPVEVAAPEGTRIVRRTRVARRGRGDLSNTQFAILGLRACLDAGIEIPRATWQAALGYVTRCQNQDGGWGYVFDGKRDRASYASMTSAGIAGAAVAEHALGLPAGAAVLRGVEWLGKNFRPDENVNARHSHVVDPLAWHYYYLYSIERVGRLLGMERIGTADWYSLGARYLLSKQRANGSWCTGIGATWTGAGDMETADTCFAILFLKRATPPLIPTESSLGPPPPRSRAEVEAALGSNGDASKISETPRTLRMTLVGDEAWAVQWKELLERCGVQSTTALPSNPARWESADVVVLYFLDVGFWTPERLAQLDALLERGGGAVFCNAAIYSEKAAELAGRTGLAYDPEKTTWKQGRLLITFSKEHPLGRGLEGFDLVDTAFRPLAGQADVVAWGRQGRAGGESRNDGKNDSFPVLWTHEKGKGRVFGSTVGQFYWTFDDPLFRLAWLRGLAWAAGEPQDRFRALAKEGVSFR